MKRWLPVAGWNLALQRKALTKPSKPQLRNRIAGKDIPFYGLDIAWLVSETEDFILQTVPIVQYCIWWLQLKESSGLQRMLLQVSHMQFCYVLWQERKFL